jgi:UDP-N-acetyl-D-glucosamine dehydrogenase
LISALNTHRLAVNGSRILLIGLAYKKNTGDARESPARVVAERLLTLGADVRAADPHLAFDTVDGRIRLVDGTAEEARASDAVVVLVDHDAFDLDAIVAASTYVLDTRHCVAGPNVEYL